MATTNIIAITLENYLARQPTVNEYHMLKSQIKTIQRILKFNKDVFISLVKKNKKKFFSDIKTTPSDIKNSILQYFTKQHNVTSIGKLYTIIELQNLLVTTYTNILGVLTIKQPDIVLSQVVMDTTAMKKLAANALNSMNVANITEKVMGRHNVSLLVDDVNKLIEEYLRRHNKTCICYGSYSLYLLNSEIKYGDIDILQTNSRTFLINLAFLIKFITGNNVILIKVPYLKNYMVLKDKDENHIIDSFNIRQDTMNMVPKILIDNIYIVDPVFQCMAMLKMLSQYDRLEDLAKNPDKQTIRLATLLEYIRCKYGIVFNGNSNNMPMKAILDKTNRIITVDTSKYNFSYIKAYIYLDEISLTSDILDLNANDSIDFENVTNSIFLIHNNILYTYFSNTILLSDEKEIHEISLRALSAHILMYQILIRGEYINALSDILNSLMFRPSKPIYLVIPRDKKIGRHGIIDIEKDTIIH
ncbi:Poly (A) polymerase catalytic subunit [Eptesipox virus]|uniref:Poly(A) polymerase catalytic subunit n=1 Tax=Eptesipox virus TaxID=1329402 RepID=A0A220T698_9POXV|nr:Poly (A) polymerase catalytic subunit [Eptesipox virus]ASK51236.1 Poly (A) polymerase catalytic subunit [Eptesipox virus]WAH70994.1 poly (A) polymerase catalytic subunit [Eptesipox virus]